MSIRDFNAIKTKLHFLGVASIDREIVQQKTGKKDNKGNEKMKGVVAKESRKDYFLEMILIVLIAKVVSQILFLKLNLLRRNL